jgi:hypothetical protein
MSIEKMNTRKILLVALLFLPVACCLLLSGCKTKHAFFREEFSDYKTDAFFFRAVGYGEDTDMQRARSKAIHSAKIDIARNANAVCQQIIIDVLNQTNNNENINLKEQFIAISTESISESLFHIIVEDVIFRKDNNNQYICYAKVKVQEGNVFETFANRSQEKMNMNVEIFKQIVDKAINTLNTSQK